MEKKILPLQATLHLLQRKTQKDNYTLLYIIDEKV